MLKTQPLKLNQLLSSKNVSSVRSSGVIAEFNFVDTGGEPFDDRANLAARKVMGCDVFEQCNHR